MTQILAEQEVFDRAIARLKEMTGRATADPLRMDCAYRSVNGPCLVGMFIPDELYDPEFEGMRADDLPNQALPGVAHLKHSLLTALQEEVHDPRMNWGRNGFTGWDSTASVAARFGLKFTPPVSA